MNYKARHRNEYVSHPWSGGAIKPIEVPQAVLDDRERRQALRRTAQQEIMGDPPLQYHKAAPRIVPAINPTLGIAVAKRRMARLMADKRGRWWDDVSLPRISILETE